MKTLKKFFPDSTIGEVHQDGTELSKMERGVRVEITIPDGARSSGCAIIHSESCNHYAEIGLRFDGKELVDYDGVFELPKEVSSLLKENGYKAEEFE